MIKNKKRLLVFQPTIGVYRIDLFNSLIKNFDVNISIEYLSSEFEIFDSSKTEELLNIKPQLLNKFFKLRSRQFYRGYWNTIKNFNPDIIFVSEFGIDALMAILYKKIFMKKYKIVSICDDSYHMLEYNCDFSKFHKITRKLLTPFLDELILVEPQARDWYRSHYGKGIFYPIIYEESSFRQRLNQALSVSNEYMNKFHLSNEIVYIYVGRLISIKNVDSLISAYKNASIPNSKLIIIGDGEKEADLRKLASDNSNIIFLGRLSGDNLYAWYNIADVLVLPSLVEPFGAVTNEALISGCKVLVSKNAGSKCLVEDGVNGYHIDPNDKNELINKLIKISSEISSEKLIATEKLKKSLVIKDFKTLTEELIRKIENF